MNVATTPHTERALPLPRSLLRFLPWTWTEWTAVLVGGASLVRLLVACTVGLTDTEAYYAQWARAPALSYYDHPPLVAWTTWIAQRLVTDPWAVRLGPVLYAAAFAALLYRLGARLFSPRAGFLAVAIVTAVPAFAFIGFLLNPEALLAPLWIAFLLLLDDLREHEEAWRPLALGVVVGTAFLAKYTAVLAVPVTLLYVAGSPATRRWLRRPSFYGGGVVALALATPVVAWNALHGWPSLRLHLADRMTRPAGEGWPGAIARVASGQLGVFHPIVLPALLATLAYALTRARRDRRYRLLATASAPVLAFLLVVMVRAGDSEPHWTMVAYAPLAVAAGGFVDEATGRARTIAHALLRGAIALSVAAAAVCLVHLRSTGLMRALPSYDADRDPFNETLGWEGVRELVAAHAERLGPGAVAVTTHNVSCGHLQAATDDRPPVYCAAPRRTQFDFIGRRTPPAGAPVVLVDSDHHPADAAVALPGRSCSVPEAVEIERGGCLVARYRVRDCAPLARGAP
jgi:hypothetical protein